MITKFFCTLFVFLFIYLFIFYLIWRFYNCYNVPIVKMKYKNWKSLYSINPSFYYFLAYRIEDMERIYYSFREPDIFTSPKARIVFSFFGFLQWKCFMLSNFIISVNRKQNNKSKESQKALKDILTQAQKDIDVLKENTEKEFNKERINYYEIFK